MNSLKYPNLRDYVEKLAAQDKGVLLVCMIAVIVAGLLVNSRFFWPDMLPKMRIGLLVGFYLSLLVLVIVKELVK
jgi:hypothetical protein